MAEKVFEINKHGVCTNLNIHKVFQHGRAYLEIHTAEINGRWYAGSDGAYAIGGWGSPVTARGKSYNTENDALIAELMRIAKHPEMIKIPGYEDAVRKFYNSLTEPTLF